MSDRTGSEQTSSTHEKRLTNGACTHSVLFVLLSGVYSVRAHLIGKSLSFHYLLSPNARLLLHIKALWSCAAGGSLLFHFVPRARILLLQSTAIATKPYGCSCRPKQQHESPKQHGTKFLLTAEAGKQALLLQTGLSSHGTSTTTHSRPVFAPDCN